MNEAYTTDFIARCIAAEALEKAESGGSDVADVDASVSNSQLTIQLEDSNGSPVGSGATVNLPSGLPPSTSSDEGKVLTVNSSGNAEWDESEVNTFRTAYVPLTSADYTTGYDGTNRYLINFDAPAAFELLEVRISYRITLTCGWYQDATLSFTDVLSIPSSVSDTPREGRKLYTEMMKDEYIGEEPDITHIFKTITLLMGSNFIRYNSTTGKIQLEIGNFTAGYSNYVEGYPENIDVASISNVEILSLGYVAYGSDDYVVYDGLQAGTGLDLDGNVINLDIDYGASFELSINSSTYVITATLKDQNGNTLGTPQTIDLPLESVVVNGSYDDTTKKIILTLQNGNTVEFSVADLVDGLETSAHAAATYQPIGSYATTSDIADMATETWVGQQGFETSAHAASTYQTQAGMSNYATQTDISDMATQTWVNQQGYLTDANEVPDVGSTDDGKILTASYTGGVGSYSWQNAPSGGLQVETDGTNYWITVNSIRLYFASSAPSAPAGGSIPDGSIGIGW